MGDSTQATRESHQREALLRQMAKEIPGVLWSTDCQLRLTSTWGAGLADFNAPPNRAVGISLCDRLQIEDAEHPVIAAHKRALQGESVSLEIEWEGRPYQARVAPLRDNGGQIVGCIGVAQDISEKKRMQEALEQSEERYRLAVTAGRAAIWDWDLETNAVFVDPAGKALQGYEDHEVGNHLDELVRFVHADDWDRLLAKGQAYLQGQEPRFEAEFRILHKDGSYRSLVAQGTAVRDASGKPCRMLGTAVDITERKQAEEALCDSRRELGIRNRIAETFLTTPGDEMYAEVLQVVLEALQSEHGIFGYINENGDMVAPSLTRDVWDQCQVPDKDIVFPRQTWGGIWGRALLENKTCCSNEPFSVPRGHIPMRRALVVPVAHHDEVVGILEVANKATDYDETDKALLEVIAGSVAPMLHARLQKERHERQRRQAEEALRESEEKFRSVAEQSPCMIFIRGESGVVYANRKCEEIVGYRREEFYSPDFHYLTLIAPESLELVKSNFARHMKGEEIEPYEYALLAKDGRRIEAIIATTLISYGGERAILGTVTDITERKQAEEAVRRARDELEEHVRERTEELAAANRQLRAEVAERKHAEKALRESEERFRLAFEEGPLGMSIVNEDQKYVRVNRAFCEMLEYSEEELVGKRYTDVTHPEDVDKCVGMHAKGIKGELSRAQFEKRFVTKTGEIIWARLTGSFVRDRQGRPLYALAMYENITEQKQAEETLRRAERLASVGTLAAGIAHEINNPLGAIMLSAETALAAKEQPDDEILEKALHNIRAAAVRGSRIVKSMLQFARDEVSEKWLSDLGEVARRATNATRGLANERQVSVQLALPDDLPELCLNPTEMEQVLVNLISNAIQASRPGDCVMVSIRPTSDSVQILVEDQGRGMTETQRSRAFDPFYTTRQQEGGAGLGLSIADAIVQEHGGTIHAESSSLGGITMRIVLPIGAPQS